MCELKADRMSHVGEMNIERRVHNSIVQDTQALIQDAKRWRFMSRVMQNPEGPEATFLHEVSELAPDVSEEEDFAYLTKVVDEGIKKF